MNPDPVVAYLEVQVLQASVEWFRHTLGFSLESLTGEPPHQAEIRRGAARLVLRSAGGSGLVSDLQAGPAAMAASIEVDHLDTLKELYDRARITGAFISRKIEAKPWGAWVFVMRDLDGHLLMLGAPQTTA